MGAKKFRILIIIPAFNESENLPDLYLKILESKIDLNFDVLLINDSSTDNTQEIAKDRFNSINLPVNLGIGGAVQTGYIYALQNNYDIAIQCDGDNQHNPDFFRKLVEPIITNKAELVIGSRFLENKGFQSTFIRRMGIRFFSKIIQTFNGLIITDPTSGFRACNHQIIKEFVKYYPIDYPEPETLALLLRKGYKITEIPVTMNERIGGKSSISALKSIYYIFKVSSAIIIDWLKKF